MNFHKHSFYLLLFLAIFFTQCKKEAPTTATIKIIDSRNKPVEEVYLIVSCPDFSDKLLDCNVQQQDTTNKRGESQFTFELPSILSVKGYKMMETIDSTGNMIIDSFCVDGFVTLKEFESVTQTIEIVRCSEL